MSRFPEIYLSERIVTRATPSFRDAVDIAAEAAGLTVADFVRDALSDRMAREGFEHQRLPILSTLRSR